MQATIKNMPAQRLVNWLLLGMVVFAIHWLYASSSLTLDFSSDDFKHALLMFSLQYTNISLITVISLCLLTRIHPQDLIENKFNHILFIMLATYQALAFTVLALPLSHHLSQFFVVTGTLFSGLFFRFAIQHKQSSFFASLAALLLINTICCLPLFAHLISTSNNHPVLSYFFSISRINMLLLAPLLMMLGYLVNQNVTLALIRDARFLRITHYLLMLLFGIALGLKQSGLLLNQLAFFLPPLITTILICAISIFFAAQFSIIFNNLSDITIDKICNQHRPHINKCIDLNTYANIGWACAAISIGYAAFINYQAVLLISGCMAAYWLYSMPPMRLKRIPILSKLILSINSIFLIVLGYHLVLGEVSDFPKIIYGIYLVLFTLTANIIDLKDVDGDSAAGIRTLPTLVGMKTAKRLLGYAAIANYCAFYFLFPNLYFLVPLLITGLLQSYLINRNNYDEKYVILFSNLSMAGLIGLIILMIALNIH